jgi:hypothetical protein
VETPGIVRAIGAIVRHPLIAGFRGLREERLKALRADIGTGLDASGLPIVDGKTKVPAALAQA